MKRKKYADELTEEELRFRLMQKKTIGRDARIASYRAGGRVIDAANAPINSELKWNSDRSEKEILKTAPPQKKFDKILLAIELLAVAGVIVMLVIGSQILQNINRESAKSMILPTLTPTPLIQAVVLPGGHTTVSYCHIARCVCRRAERLAVHLHELEPTDEQVIKYLNRLSDYLFVLARKLSFDLQAEEVKWIPRK